MLTDDKVTSDDSADVYDNINTRDQNRTMIVLAVLMGVFIAGLVGLGLSHAPQTKSEEPQQMAPIEGQKPGASEAEDFSVRKPIGAVELPGSVGKPQHWSLNGVGNTPAPTDAAAKKAAGTESSPAETTKSGEAEKPAQH
jgi:hypothetical protein